VRAFLAFLLALVAAALLGAALAYPVYELLHPIAPWPFHRIANRVTLIVLVLVLVIYCRRFGLTRRGDFGYGLPRRRFLSVALLFGALGILSAAAGAAFLLATHLREWGDPGALQRGTVWLHLLLAGLGSGIAVALIEETAMRGALYGAIERESGGGAAIALTSALFAVLHFYARTRIPAAQVGPASGFVLIGTFFSPWAHPAGVADAFLAWLAVGGLLGATRACTGNIAAALGLHAGWVLVLRILQIATVPGANRALAGWVGRFDGLLGYWVLPWAALIALALWASRAAWVPYARGALRPAAAARPCAAP